MTDLAALLRVASEAVDQAAELVTSMAVGAITSKGDRDMASEIDYAVEDKVRSFLLSETPEIGFLGEEHGAAGTDKPMMWALDPVDGTANLVNGLPLCAVSLGLFQGDRSVLGVVDLPFLGERYKAAEGHGAFCNEAPIRPSNASRLSEAIVAIGDYAVGNGASERNRPRFALTQLLAERALRVRMLGSAAIDLVWVASGKLDACIALGNHPWDTAGGVAIATEAGALALDSGGLPHRATSKDTLAVAPSLAESLLTLLRDAARVEI